MKKKSLPTAPFSLFEAFKCIKNEEEFYDFLKDLCTPAEIKALEERWVVAQLLDEQELSYREIQEKTGVSLMTITRVARFLQHEPYQGYRTALDCLRSKR